MKDRHIETAFSPCPNDTYIFHAMIEGLTVTKGFGFSPRIADVEELNQAAFEGAYPVTKLSSHAYLLLKDRYTILESGAALGYGCGPLIVASKDLPSLKHARIAVPGMYTTAALLMKLWEPDCRNIEITRFDHILPGIASGRYDAGLIIHEGRFVYSEYGCREIIDLGKWWEDETTLPIPLGCIAVRNDTAALKAMLEDSIRSSIQYARINPGASKGYIRSHAQELDDEVIADHIALYVNEFSISLGKKGRQALDRLEETARCRGIIK